MGIQNNISVSEMSSKDVMATSRSTDTLNYVTDLLGELQTIANLTGLSDLSGDIQGVISKHMVAS